MVQYLCQNSDIFSVLFKSMIIEHRIIITSKEIYYYDQVVIRAIPENRSSHIHVSVGRLL